MPMCWAFSVCSVLLFLGNASCKEKLPQNIRSLLTAAERDAVASVDGDPDFIVGAHGLAQPLCFRLEGEPGHVVRLLQDPESGVVVNARISRPVPGSRKTYLSAILITRRNFRVVAKVGRVLVNRYRFEWGPVSVRLVHGHRVLIAPTLLALTLRNKNVTLVVKRHLPEGRLHPNGTIISTNASHSSPNTATTNTDDNHTNVSPTSSRRRGSRRRDNDLDLERGPRRRSRRNRRRNNKKNNSNIGNNNNNNKNNNNNGDNNENDDGIVHYSSQKGHRVKRNVNRYSENVQTGALPPPVYLSEANSIVRVRRQTRNGNPDSSDNRQRSRSRSRVKVKAGSKSRSRSGQDGMSRSRAQPDVSNDDAASASRLPPREQAAFMGFYVSDARDLSPQTHGLLGQFLHKKVTLQKVRRKSNGVMKARLLVEKPRPHRVKAKLRTRTNLALNTSSTCWWLRDGGRGVVDGIYTDYLVSRFRDTDLLPLPPGQIAQ